MDSNEMEYEKLLQELRRLKMFKKSWHSQAETLGKVKTLFAGHGQSTRRMKEAANACDFTPNTVNRLLSVKEFYDAVKDEVDQLRDLNPNDLSFPCLEIIKRTHQVDPQAGREMLVTYIEKKTPFTKLREKYQNVVSQNTKAASDHQIARMETQEFESAALKAIQESTSDLFGKELAFEFDQHKTSLPVSDYATLREDQSGSLSTCGFELVIFRAKENLKQRVESLLYRLVFASSFFDATWVIFASTTGKERVEAFCSMLSHLECSTIGVAILPWGEQQESAKPGKLEILRKPQGEPVPDWREQRDEYLSKLGEIMRPT